MAQSTDAYVRSSAVIAGGEAISNAVDISKLQLLGVAVIVPSAWTAADIGFEGSIDGVLWAPLCDDEGVRIKITGVTTNQSKLYIAPSGAWALGALPYMRFVSLNTSNGANINQAANRELTFIRLSS
jgi:hypothetical protein